MSTYHFPPRFNRPSLATVDSLVALHAPAQAGDSDAGPFPRPAPPRRLDGDGIPHRARRYYAPTFVGAPRAEHGAFPRRD